MSHWYLGLDSSTQSLTAMVLEADGSKARILHEVSLNFDSTFPAYQTRNGVLQGKRGEAHTPPQLWVAALEKILESLRDKGIDLLRIRAIAVSGQQHGSVYLNGEASGTLAALDAGRGLEEQLTHIYSRRTSPIWMDASTTQECEEITEALGGPDEVCRLTGSEAFERFTGPQIRKFAKTEPEAYDATAHICLVSSFIPSLLSGRIAPIDPGDGAGMNLMDIRKKDWSPEALKATAKDLRAKLPEIRASHHPIGKIAAYFAKRFGFSAECLVLPGTGDNPSSLIGLGLVSRGSLGISLGTSDTLFACMSQPETDPTGQSHVFGSPTGEYMSLSCYKNGSLAREAVREAFGLDWDAFSNILRETPAGNSGRLMLPYFDTEIIPKINQPGVVREGFDDTNRDANVRAVVESQMISMALHSQWMPDRPARIYATGGASTNTDLLQIMADVFQAPVFRQASPNAACLGSALRAWHGERESAGSPISWESVTSPFLDTDPSRAIHPRRELAALYSGMVEAYARKEMEHMQLMTSSGAEALKP